MILCNISNILLPFQESHGFTSMMSLCTSGSKSHLPEKLPVWDRVTAPCRTVSKNNHIYHPFDLPITFPYWFEKWSDDDEHLCLIVKHPIAPVQNWLRRCQAVPLQKKDEPTWSVSHVLIVFQHTWKTCLVTEMEFLTWPLPLKTGRVAPLQESRWRRRPKPMEEGSCLPLGC